MLACMMPDTLSLSFFLSSSGRHACKCARDRTRAHANRKQNFCFTFGPPPLAPRFTVIRVCAMCAVRRSAPRVCGCVRAPVSMRLCCEASVCACLCVCVSWMCLGRVRRANA